VGVIGIGGVYNVVMNVICVVCGWVSFVVWLWLWVWLWGMAVGVWLVKKRTKGEFLQSTTIGGRPTSKPKPQPASDWIHTCMHGIHRHAQTDVHTPIAVRGQARTLTWPTPRGAARS
jgi:hypothetical protein